jgi:hypothetical protein
MQEERLHVVFRMRQLRHVLMVSTVALFTAVACGDDEDNGGAGAGGQPGGGSAGQSQGGAAGTSNAGGTGGSTGVAGRGGTAGMQAGGTAGSGGAAGSSGTAGRGGQDGSSGSSGAAGTSGQCPGPCPAQLTCCNSQCVELASNPSHCGRCRNACDVDEVCGINGTCQTPVCSIEAGSCPSGSVCCGSSCCGPGQLCCNRGGGPGGLLTCHTPNEAAPTCPRRCDPLCG